MRLPILCAALSLAACTTKEDVMAEQPLLDRVFPGDFLEVAACTHNAIQTGDYTLQPQVAFVPSRSWAEVQTTATGAFTGTIYGQVTRFEDLDGNSFRVIIRAPHTADGDVAVEAVRTCTAAT